MMILLGGLVLVFLVVVASIYCLIRLAPGLGLVALPGEHRRHQSPTPMVGGIAIYLGILTGFLLIDASFGRLLPSLLLLCVVGALDDRFSLPSWSRFLTQGIAVYLMIELTGAQLDTLGHLINPQSNVLLGKWAMPVTVFAAIGVINAVNMSDGLDGLAGSLVVLVLVSLLLTGSVLGGLIMISLVSVGGFLCWNMRLFRKQAAIFMGDAGSTMLGLLIAYLLIIHSQLPGGFPPVTALWIMALPLIDAVAVLLVRPLTGQSPFAADRIHYHHLLLAKGLGVNTTLVVVLLCQLAMIGVGILMWKAEVPEYLQFFSFLAMFCVYFFILLKTVHRTNNN